MDFDSGLGNLAANLASTGEGTIELRTDSPTGTLVASYAIPSTNGAYQDVKHTSTSSSLVYVNYDLSPATKTDIGGIVFMTFTGNNVTVDLDCFEFDPFIPTTNGDITAKYKYDETSGTTATDAD